MCMQTRCLLVCSSRCVCVCSVCVVCECLFVSSGSLLSESRHGMPPLCCYGHEGVQGRAAAAATACMWAASMCVPALPTSLLRHH